MAIFIVSPLQIYNFILKRNELTQKNYSFLIDIKIEIPPVAGFRFIALLYKAGSYYRYYHKYGDNK